MAKGIQSGLSTQSQGHVIQLVNFNTINIKHKSVGKLIVVAIILFYFKEPTFTSKFLSNFLENENYLRITILFSNSCCIALSNNSAAFLGGVLPSTIKLMQEASYPDI